MSIKKRVLSGFLSLIMTLSLVPAISFVSNTEVQAAEISLGITDTITVENKEAVSVLSFDDVATSHWTHTDIMTIVNKGAIGGTKEPVNEVGHFDTSGAVSLGQFQAIATR